MILNDLFNLIFPNCCYTCGEILDNCKYICSKCFKNIQQTNYHKNPRSNELFAFFYKYFEIEGAFSMFYYEKSDILANLIHRLKYNNKKNIGIWLGELYGKILKKDFKHNFDYIIPVPLHKSKERQRGYNQSKMIAIGLNKYISGCINECSLIKVKKTNSQTLKGKRKRRTDIIDTFKLINAELLCGKKILLVDDIITSGSTMQECIKTIKETIDCKITICSIGRTQNKNIKIF